MLAHNGLVCLLSACSALRIGILGARTRSPNKILQQNERCTGWSNYSRSWYVGELLSVLALTIAVPGIPGSAVPEETMVVCSPGGSKTWLKGWLLTGMVRDVQSAVSASRRKRTCHQLDRPIQFDFDGQLSLTLIVCHLLCDSARKCGKPSHRWRAAHSEYVRRSNLNTKCTIGECIAIANHVLTFQRLVHCFLCPMVMIPRCRNSFVADACCSPLACAPSCTMVCCAKGTLAVENVAAVFKSNQQPKRHECALEENQEGHGQLRLAGTPSLVSGAGPFPAGSHSTQSTHMIFALPLCCGGTY